MPKNVARGGTVVIDMVNGSNWICIGTYTASNARYVPVLPSSGYPSWILTRYNGSNWVTYADYNSPNGWTFVPSNTRCLTLPDGNKRPCTTLTATPDSTVPLGQYRFQVNSVAIDFHNLSTGETGTTYEGYSQSAPPVEALYIHVVCMTVDLSLSYAGSIWVESGYNRVFYATATPSGGEAPYNYSWTLPSGATNVTGTGTASVRFELFTPTLVEPGEEGEYAVGASVSVNVTDSTEPTHCMATDSKSSAKASDGGTGDAPDEPPPWWPPELPWPPMGPVPPSFPPSFPPGSPPVAPPWFPPEWPYPPEDNPPSGSGGSDSGSDSGSGGGSDSGSNSESGSGSESGSDSGSDSGSESGVFESGWYCVNRVSTTSQVLAALSGAGVTGASVVGEQICFPQGSWTIEQINEILDNANISWKLVE